jgi:hypothetical protein
LILKYAPALAPPVDGAISTSAIASEDGYLQTHLKAAVEALWANSNGSWEVFLSTLAAEVGEQVRHESSLSFSLCYPPHISLLISSLAYCSLCSFYLSYPSRIPLLSPLQAETVPALIAVAMATAGELTEARLKALIKINGGPNSMPKKRPGSTDKLEKGSYVTALVGVLRARNQNDFSKVVKVLETELTKGKSNKGFGSS